MDPILKDDWKKNFTVIDNNIIGMDKKIITLNELKLSLNDLKKLYELYNNITKELKIKLENEFGG